MKIDILLDVNKVKPGIIAKYVNQAAIKLLDENKVELKNSVIRLIKTLHKLLGTSFIESVPKAKIDRIEEVINS